MIEEQIRKAIERFKPATLADFESAILADRMDWKYVMRMEDLPSVLENISQHYKVLEIDNNRLFSYDNVYYDTPELELFADHHAGKANRFKVRKRSYLDSGISYLELKQKTNKMRTIKNRVPLLTDLPEDISGEAFIRDSLGKIADSRLSPSLRVRYTRISLLSNDGKERVTIDLDLEFSQKGDRIHCENMVIAEVKRKRKAYSNFILEMKKQFIHPVSISKYCFGITNLIPEIKSNLFKHNYSRINKMIA